MSKCFKCFKEFDSSIDTICPYCGFDNGSAFDENAISPGTLLKNGRYYIGNKLGQGGFAITYAAMDNNTNNKIAIKEFFPSDWAYRNTDTLEVEHYSGFKGEQFIAAKEKFIEESLLLTSAGNCPGIVNIFDRFEENETAYIVMEFVEGRTLSDVLIEKGSFDYRRLTEMLLPICNSLDKIHKKQITFTNDEGKIITREGIIHRDIAPDNLMLQPDGKVKLIDFGASIIGGTVNIDLIAKEGYAPVEQYYADNVCTAATDVYAMGAVFYHLITGRRPPKSKDREKNDTLKLLSECPNVRDEIPTDFEVAIMNALIVSPEYRTRSMSEFASEISPFAKKQETQIISEEPVDKKKSVKIIIAVAIAAIILVGGIIAAVTHKGKSVQTVTETVEIPDLYELSYKKASSTYGKNSEYGFNIEKSEDSVPTADENLQGKIAKQSPNAGASVIKGDDMIITVRMYEFVEGLDDNPDALVKMPKLTGKTKKSAVSQLREDGLYNYSFKETWNDSDAGTVIAQSVKASTEIKKSKEIILTVSKGPEVVTTESTTSQTTTAVYTTAPPYTQERTEAYTAATTTPNTQPATTKPITTQPTTAKPITTQPTTAKPVTTQPATTKPVTTQPTTTKPVTTQPTTAPTTRATTAPATTTPTTVPTTQATTRATTQATTVPVQPPETKVAATTMPGDNQDVIYDW